MKCPTCGHAIDADMRFCPECGTVCVAPQQTNIEPTVTEPQKPKKSKFSIRPKLLVSIIVLALCGVVYLVSATVLSCNSGMTFFDSLSKVAADEQEITDLKIETVDGQEVVKFTSGQYNALDKVELCAKIKVGEDEYYDLGKDAMYEFDEHGNLIFDWYHTWPSIDGWLVYFCNEVDEYKSDSNWTNYGYVTAELNYSEVIQIIVYWDQDNPDGCVKGYRRTGEEGIENLSALQDGDVITFLVPCYDGQDKFLDWYYISDEINVSEMTMEIAYYDISAEDCSAYYLITDSFGNEVKSDVMK